MAQAVDRRLLTSVAREQCQADPCDICGQSGTGARFSPNTSIALRLHQRTNVHIHLHLHVAATRRTNMSSLGTFQNAMHYRKSGSHSLVLVFSLRGRVGRNQSPVM